MYNRKLFKEGEIVGYSLPTIVFAVQAGIQ